MRQDDFDFTIGRWGDNKRNGGHTKALGNKISIDELKKREKASEILSKKEKKQLNFGKKSNTSPLTALFLKKGKNGGSGTKTPSVYRVANGPNAKTALVNYPPPKKNVQTREGTFFDQINMFFRKSSVPTSNTRPLPTVLFIRLHV